MAGTAAASVVFDLLHRTLASSPKPPAGSAEPGGCVSSCPGGVWPDDLARWRDGEPKVAGSFAFLV
ncbi:hypothetical protein ACVGXO_05270 [Enterobacter hormaechei]|uniref:Uncharacterized protein n=1 Tax=Citrobacter freundii TaxID=546 RepID=A0A3T0VE88_CITFR|nr:hypothetical protein [Citrobacter freundii]